MTHPITPPPKLLRLWEDLWFHNQEKLDVLLLKAFRAGADLELEECCEWIPKLTPWDAEKLRAARRPQPTRLKEQAQQALSRFDCNAHTTASEMVTDFALIRSALDALPDD